MPTAESSASSAPQSTVIEGTNGTYALLDVIGRGAYGVVYKGIWREEGRHVAVKRVRRSRLSPDEEKKLQEEITLLRNLRDTYIVKYIEAVDDSRSPSLDIVMEYVEGGSLFTLIQNLRRSFTNPDRILPESTVAKFIKQVLLGLRYLHRQGVVHSDIKGANILVTKESEVKLADFGLASTKRGSDDGSGENAACATENDMALGTPYWMAPEIVKLTGKSTASDIWSVGCTVIELLTGFPPYHEFPVFTALFRINSDDCPPLPADISNECEDFLRKCFNKDMNTRATAEELLTHAWIFSAQGQDQIDGGSQGDGDTEHSLYASNEFEGVDGQGGTPISNEDGLNQGIQNLQIYEEEDDEDFDDVGFLNDEETGAINNSLSAVDQGMLPDGATGASNQTGHASDGNSELYSSIEVSAPFHQNTDGFPLEHNPAALRDDPFRDIMDDPEADLERERQRRQKELWDRVKAYASSLGGPEDTHVFACESLVDMLRSHPEQRYNLIYDPGLLPILEVLERGADASSRVVESTLRLSLSLLNKEFASESPHDNPFARVELAGRAKPANGHDSLSTVDSHPRADLIGYAPSKNIPHDLCLAGFVPSVMQFVEPSYSFEVRRLAARFLEAIVNGESTLHMFVACRGFTAFVSMLAENVLEEGEVPVIALNGIDRMLSMDNQRHKRHFCRRFTSCGLLLRIAQCMSKTIDLITACRNSPRSIEVLDLYVNRLAGLLQTFAARADPHVKASITTPEVLYPMISILSSQNVPQEAIQSILCCLRDLSRDPQTHSALQEARAVEKLVGYLSQSHDTVMATDNKPRQYIISTLHNLCIVSPVRQEAAARSGLVPHLIRYIRSNDNLRSLCVDIYSGLACAGHQTRLELAKCDGLNFYIELFQLLSMPGTVRKWQARVLRAVSDWLSDRTEASRVETQLTMDRNSSVMCNALSRVGVEDIEGVLEPYWRIITTSNRVNVVYGQNEELVSAMVRWLEKMSSERSRKSVGGPRGRLLLLRTLLAHAKLWTATTSNRGLVSALRILLEEMVSARDEAITVREQASLLLRAVEGK